MPARRNATRFAGNANEPSSGQGTTARTDGDDDDTPFLKLLELINVYKIRFLHHNSEWPSEHEDLLKIIKEIGSEKFATYAPNESRDDYTVAQTRERVSEVVRSASRACQIRGNEETLRFYTEPFIFKRFDSETVCHACGRRLWASEYAHRLNKPEQEGTSLPCHSGKSLCRCSHSKRYERNDVVFENTSVFSTQCSTMIQRNTKDEIAGYPIPRQQPDRVIGLAKIGSIRYYIENKALPIPKHTPFTTQNHTVYPFLISEAKSGGQNPGMDSIDVQTAFPIRTCLLLQERLREASNANFSPLVWYMPFQGDLWKVAACVMHDEEVRIHHLWTGATRDPDAALQLLHIIDFIATWAQTTFRDTVIACLAHGLETVQRQTPAWLPQSPIEIDPVQRQPSQPQRMFVQNESIRPEDTVTDANIIDVSTDDSEAESTLLSRSSRASTCPPRESRSTTVVDWRRRMAVHNARLVKFKFRHIILPEDTQSLTEMLRGTFKHNPTQNEMKRKARQFARILATPELTIALTLNQISFMKNEWLRDEKAPGSTTRAGDVPMRTYIMFDSTFDWQTWYVVRQLSYICFSSEAIKCLADLTGQDSGREIWSAIQHTTDTQFNSVMDALTPFNRLSSSLSAEFAIQNLSLYLHFNTFRGSCHWEVEPSEITDGLLGTTGFDSTGYLNYCVQNDNNVVKVLPRSAASQPFALSAGLDLNEGSAILLRKPDYWPTQTEEWCFLDLGPYDPNKGIDAARIVQIVMDFGQFYVPQKSRNIKVASPSRLGEQEKSFWDIFMPALFDSGDVDMA